MQQDQISDKTLQKRQDRFMRERAKEWLADCTLWHFQRVTGSIDPALLTGLLSAWFVLADGNPAQTAAVILGLNEEEKWNVLAYKTFPRATRSPDVIEYRLVVLLEDIRQQSGEPIWRSDQKEI